MKRAFALAAAAGLAVPAIAQQPSFTSDASVSMRLRWIEVNGNSNGILESGETAEIAMDVGFTNQFAIATFSPPIGTFTSGTILGLGTGFIDIDGTGGTQGTFTLRQNNTQTNNGTTGLGVRSGWRVGSGPGSVNASGTGITQVQFGQFPASPELAVTMNPVNRMLAFRWTPASYAARSVTFSIAPVSGNALTSVYLDLDHSVGASVYISPSNWVLPPLEIPIAPAPASAGALALAALARRAKRKEEPP
jgi:hypothetical protein